MTNNERDSAIDTMESAVMEVLRTTYDPEIPVNIYELGLVYGVTVSEDGEVLVEMTLTAPSCPVAAIMPAEIESRLREVPGVRTAKVEVVWDPPWSPERMSEAARLELGFVG